ncbi:MAG: pilus assembly protein PilM [Ignavibacteriaceae bacterium]
MTALPNKLGFNLSENKLQIVELRFTGQEYLLHNIDEAFFDEPLHFESDKETKILLALQSAFNEVVISKAITTTEVSFSLPLHCFTFFQVPYDNTLLHNDLEDQFRWEFSVLFPYKNEADYQFQFYEIEKNLFVEEPKALVVTMRKKIIDLLFTFCERNNLLLTTVDCDHFAFDKSVQLINQQQNQGFIGSIYLDDSLVSFELLFEQKPIFMKVFPLKKKADFVKEIKVILEKEIPVDLTKYKIDKCYFGGDEITISFVSQVEDQLQMPCYLVNPFMQLNASENFQNEKYYREKAHSFAAAAGIAFRLE